ncbi:alpha-L-fucosidase [Pedobacter frigoris]|uniref:alpha-L-fucosidase n=1 Tax=Pedobacter frigoris TaxID=2571272 RepID=UPI00292CE729|nr:alpha-L-fucosidase [Pedobacter frigoris]
MKKLSILLFTLATFGAVAQNKIPLLKTSNTIPVFAGDTREMIVNKAAHVVPTKNQHEALKNEFIAFIHIGPNTFTRMEWGNGKEDPKIFDLKELHTDQWCQAMKSAGMKMVIITVKHHDGFVLWQSRYTKHGIMSTGFQNGKGDILKELSASCKKYGLKLGIYLSPADLFQIESPTGLYGNLSKVNKRTVPRQVSGRPFINKTKFEFEIDDYNEYFLNQLFELLTEYGQVDEVWFDGAHPKTKGGQKYNYAAWKKLIHTLAPKAVIFGREDIRWCGNEAGKTRDTEWNVIPYSENPNEATNFPDMTRELLGDREDLYKAKFLHYQQAETNTSIREGWFYRDDNKQKVRSADDVFDIYERSTGGNSTFLLNIPPNRDGKFSPTDVQVLNEVGKRIKDTYGKNLFSRASGPKEVLDQSTSTYVLNNQQILLSTASAVTINRLVLQEAIATHGERVEQHALDAWIDNQWKEIARATNIGYKRILRFPEITSSKFRVRILKSRAIPAISNITAHYYTSRPPQIQFSRDPDGLVKLTPFEQEFNWKPHGEHAAQNLNTDVEIYYTTDGTEPTNSSLKYTKPFLMNSGEVKALSYSKNIKGSVNTNVFGMLKSNWKVLEGSSEKQSRNSTIRAFDENDRTYWQSKEGMIDPIALDLGKQIKLKGFAYTPPKENSDGMIQKGIIQTSTDGNTWADTEGFEFGNLINDPVRRIHYFKAPIYSRFIRLVPKEIAGNGKTVAIAELDFIEN